MATNLVHAHTKAVIISFRYIIIQYCINSLEEMNPPILHVIDNESTRLVVMAKPKLNSNLLDTQCTYINLLTRHLRYSILLLLSLTGTRK